MYRVFQKSYYHLRYTGCLRKVDIICGVLGALEKLISFEMYWVFKKSWYHLRYTGCHRKVDTISKAITWPVLVEMISNINSVCRNNTEF